MKVSVNASIQRQVCIEADLCEFVEIYFAANPKTGRRSKRQKQTLERFGQSLLDADPDLAARVERLNGGDDES